MTRSNVRGLSLVELLVAIALSAVIIAGIIQVFLSNRQAFNMNQAMTRAQENGRFVVSFMSANIRQSGSFGCVPESNAQSNNVVSHTPLITNFDAIQLVNPGFALGTADGADGGANAFDDPDTLVILQLEEAAATVTNAAGAFLTVVAGENFSPGDFFLVSNCLVGDFIQAGAGTDNTQVVDATAGLRTSQYAVLNDVSTVSEIRHLAFTVNNEVLEVDENANFDGTGAQELLDGIENIQYQFGVDDDGDFVPDYFDDMRNIAVGDVPDIVAVNISILTVSDNEVTSSPQTIDFNSKVLQMGDNRFRQVFDTTVTLRNRLN